MGAGSARPVVSTTTRSSAGIAPLASSSKSFRSASTRSSRVVQHTHPFSRRTVFSSARLRRWWSRPTLPNSLTRTAVLARDGAESTFERRVVLPLPRKPVTTVTGFLAALAPVHWRLIPQRFVQRRAQGRVEWVERPAGEPLGRGPQGAKVPDELGAAFAVAQDVLGPVPVADLEAVVAQYLVRYGRPAGAFASPVAPVFVLRPGVYRRASPVLGVFLRPVYPVDELPAEDTHERRCLLLRVLQALDVGRLAAGLALPKVVGDLLQGHPANTFVGVYVANKAFEHQEVLWSAGHIRVDGRGIDGVVHLAVDPVELVAPELFYVLAPDQRLHPLGGRLGVVDRGPLVPLARPVGSEVVVLQGAVVFVAVLQQDLVRRVRRLPPRRRVAGGLLAGEILY